MIGPTDLHPSPAPHFKTFQVFLICCPKRPSFSTIQNELKKILTKIGKANDPVNKNRLETITPPPPGNLCLIKFWGPFERLAKRDRLLRHVFPSACDNSTPTGRIFMKFSMNIFENSVQKIKVSFKSYMNIGYFTWMTGTLHEWRVLYMNDGYFTWMTGTVHE